MSRCSGLLVETQGMRQQTLTVFYDGACPVCAMYMRYYRLGDANLRVALVDLRRDVQQVAEFTAMGLDVDEGMIVKLDSQVYHGADAVNVLALLSTSASFFNRCNRWLFSRRVPARVFYPVMVAGRNLVLWLLRREKLRSPDR